MDEESAGEGGSVFFTVPRDTSPGQVKRMEASPRSDILGCGHLWTLEEALRVINMAL